MTPPVPLPSALAAAGAGLGVLQPSSRAGGKLPGPALPPPRFCFPSTVGWLWNGHRRAREQQGTGMKISATKKILFSLFTGCDGARTQVVPKAEVRLLAWDVAGPDQRSKNL